MEKTAGITLLLCLLGLAHANRAPEIHNGVVHLKEDMPKGHVAFSIIATDNENDPLTYGLKGVNAHFFQVNETTGAVTIAAELDRETLDMFKVVACVSDGVNPDEQTKQITIVVEDANDNSPIFKDAPYNAAVSERAGVGTSLFKAKACDYDMGLASVVNYRIEDVSPQDGSDLFKINENTGDVVLNGSLDYNTRSTYYQLQINATDGGGKVWENIMVYQSSVTFAFITVIDIADLNPQFLRLPYTTSVVEGSPIGQSVFTVVAIDQDRGVNSPIKYTIESSTANDLFIIDGDNGIIKINSDIDREAISDGFVTLTVKATEVKESIYGYFSNTTVDVHINILDINDNAPLFYKCGVTCEEADNFMGEIAEHSSGSIFINMTVIDKDQGGQIKLTLDGPDKMVFSVSPESTSSGNIVQLMVRNSQDLDFETKEFMVVEVIAEDKANTTLRSTATVTVALKDINDNIPYFPQDSYKLKVKEHSPDGTELGVFTANDTDKLDEGKITYSLLPNNILRYFDVEPTTGRVYVKNGSLIDREVISMHVATLQARDAAQNTGITQLEITLIDINDQSPVMNREDYYKLVYEGDQLHIQIQATDADEPDTVNSQIVYEIMPSEYSDNFTIDPESGVLTNNGQLDREAIDRDLNGLVELVVTATDMGVPRRNDTATVTIEIGDINDNKPEFNKASYKFHVKEADKGAYVGSVYTRDLDQTAEFNRISFEITEGSYGRFIIRSIAGAGGYWGNISVDPDVELDYEDGRKSYTLQVQATNLDQKAAVTVEVAVEDVNDERPEFIAVETIKVTENTTITGPVGKFEAQDRDGNHSLVFESLSTTCLCDGVKKACDWFVLNATGYILANPNHTVDYELCNQVDMEAQVVDEYTEKGESNSEKKGEVVIAILDRNDNAPEFLPSEKPFFVVSETASKATSVARVLATDRDSEENQRITFKVALVQFQDTNNVITTESNLFSIDEGLQRQKYEAVIVTETKLSTGLKGTYLVTVVATDSGDLSTNTTVEIFTIDISFKTELSFAKPAEEVRANQNDIRNILTEATNAEVQVVDIRAVSDDSRSTAQTIMEAYFVYKNGTAIFPDTVEKTLSDPEYILILGQYGLTYIGNVAVEEKKTEPVTFFLFGLVGGLLIILVVLTTTLVCTRRNYRTKLKAAKAMKSAAMVVSDNQKSGPVVPGTNKYTMEGANPVLNLYIDTATDLGFDEDSSNVDRVSLNSLYEDIDMNMSEKDKSPMMIIQEKDEGNYDGHIEPLGAALAQRGQKKVKKNTSFAFDNPAMSTTDL